MGDKKINLFEDTTPPINDVLNVFQASITQKFNQKLEDFTYEHDKMVEVLLQDCVRKFEKRLEQMRQQLQEDIMNIIKITRNGDSEIRD